MIGKFNKVTSTFVVESSPTHSYHKFQTDIEKSKNFEEKCRGVSGSPERMGQVSPGLQSSGLKCTGFQSPCLKCAGLQGSNTGKNGALGLLRFNPGSIQAESALTSRRNLRIPNFTVNLSGLQIRPRQPYLGPWWDEGTSKSQRELNISNLPHCRRRGLIQSCGCKTEVVRGALTCLGFARASNTCERVRYLHETQTLARYRPRLFAFSGSSSRWVDRWIAFITSPRTGEAKMA